MDVGAFEFDRDLVAARAQLLVAARRLTGDDDEARDLVQDALARAWQFRDRFVPGSNMKAWLYCILRNQFYSKLRRQKMERRWRLEAPPPEVAYRAPQEFAMVLNDLAGSLHAIPPAWAAAVVMIGAEGRSYDEAAGVLGCSVGTMKSRLSRARRVLAVALDPGAPEGAGAAI